MNITETLKNCGTRLAALLVLLGVVTREMLELGLYAAFTYAGYFLWSHSDKWYWCTFAVLLMLNVIGVLAHLFSMAMTLLVGIAYILSSDDL